MAKAPKPTGRKKVPDVVKQATASAARRETRKVPFRMSSSIGRSLPTPKPPKPLPEY